MKTNKLLLLLFLLTHYSNIFSQSNYCWNDLNTITTKWDANNTSNTERWDWTIPGLVHPIYLRDNLASPSIWVELPYFCTKPSNSGGCNNKNTYSYEILGLSDKQDIYPEDGWELVLKDFGSPNGTIAGRATKNPVFILYNKYTGKMKVYLAVIGNKVANSAYLQIYFSNSGVKRGLFAHANTIAKPAKVFDLNAKFKSLNDYAVQNFDDDYQWLVSEIQTAYDPCTCQGDLGTSSIEVLPVLIDRSNIDANIEGTLLQEMMSTAAGVVREDDAKTSFMDVTMGAGKAAIKGYNDFTSYQKQLNIILDRSNSKYKDKLVKDWFDDYVKKHRQYQGINNLHDKYELWDNLNRTDDAYKRGLGIEKIDSYQKGSEFKLLKSIASYIPYVGSAIGIIDFFVNGGKETVEQKPSPPMVFNVSLKLSGEIIHPMGLSPVAFLVPGSYQSSPESHLVPMYNNTLGVFNILKSPSSKVGGIKPELFITFCDLNGNPYKIGAGVDGIDDRIIQNMKVKTDDNGNTIPKARLLNLNFLTSSIQNIQSLDVFKQYQLTEDIKYLVNPTAGVTVEMIDACFVFEYEDNTDLKIHDRSFVDGNKNFKFTGDDESFPFYPSIFSNLLTFEERISEIEETGIDLEYLGLDEKIIRFRTKYVPLTCLKNVTFTLYNGRTPRIYVKMLVKYKRNDAPGAESLTQIVTYDITNSFTENAQYIATDCKIAMRTKVNVGLSMTDQGQFFPASMFDFCMREKVLVNSFCAQITYNEDNHHTPNCFPFNLIKPKRDITYYSGMPGGNFTGTVTIPSNTTVTSNTHIKARNIILGNDLTIESGVQLISGENIEITPESSISPDAQLIIEEYGTIDDWGCSEIDITDLLAKDPEIDAELCSNSSYRARVSSKRAETDFILPNKNNREGFDFDLHPNPAHNIISLTLNSDETISFSITILDIVGKTVFSGIELNDAKDKSLVNIDLSELANGAYFCQIVNTKGQQIVKKFIVAK